MTSNIEEDAKTDNMSDITQLDQIAETKEDFEQLSEEENPPTDQSTPYQLLNLMVGNAEELSFHYTVYKDDKPEGEKGSFYRMGDKTVAIYQTYDMNRNGLVIRELEMEGRVHYIIDEYEIVKSYLAPAEDFLLYEMMEVTNTTPTKIVEQEDYVIYEYSLPFVQDDEIQIIYRFFIQGNALKKLKISYDNQATTTYEFSEFMQTITDEKVFDYPIGYDEEWYDYINTGEHMPPWWELGNDA